MPGLELDTPVRYVRGVGPVRAEQMNQAGVTTVLELLFYLPKRYEERPPWRPIGEWTEGQIACIAGEITRLRSGAGRKTPTVIATVSDGMERCRITWFNLPHLRSTLEVGMAICATGKLRADDHGAQLTNPSFHTACNPDQLPLPEGSRLQPVYPSAGGMNSAQVQRAVEAALDGLGPLTDYLPAQLRRRNRLPPWEQALRHIHGPQSTAQAALARRTLAYDELLLWQLRFAQARDRRRNAGPAAVLRTTAQIDARIRRRLPFELTPAQQRCVSEICRDLACSKPMLRLLQGDVGSGKTAVAVYAALVAIANRCQVAILAPTEILARQHYDKINHYLQGSAVRTALASSATTPAARQSLRDALKLKQLDLVVGTHALLEPDVRFADLGLVIIDEQQRFGVRQRQAMKFKGRCPHYLVLSATPIPRTQALATLGDLDMSVLDVLPCGPRRVTTRLVKTDHTSEAWAEIRGQLDAGRQAYVIYPLVQESEKLPLKAVTTEVTRLRARELSGYRCALLHGKMRPADKTRAVDAFRRGEVLVLVSTTVVEVGVDVPRATVMAVFHAERYGLAQLHQLRGRIGRAGHQAYFYLFTDSDEQNVRRRMQVLLDTDDGFAVAEADLQLRGPGEILGTQQHGLPDYRCADLASDADLLQRARRDARDIIERRITLDRRQSAQMSKLQSLYGNTAGPLIHVA